MRKLPIALEESSGERWQRDVEVELSKTPSVVELALPPGVEITGVGLVKLAARRKGERVAIYATSVDGARLGRADVDRTAERTPIAIRTLDGLESVTIIWAPAGG